MARRDLAFPLRVDARGRFRGASYDEHVRDMIEQLIFTNPGERVNRPDFGCGLMRQVFEPNSPEVAAALKHMVMAAILRWLGDLIEPSDVAATSEDGTLLVAVRYTVRRTGERREDMIRAGVPT